MRSEGPAIGDLGALPVGVRPDPRPPAPLSRRRWRPLLRTDGEGLPPARGAIYARDGGAP